ncbi:hypothetical protein R3W88_031474 [Solanum pinnatisectum]|uniref:Uncharacterized protein n=1 Tax=Solanum pinnatisectum TaxID=50273 RepID=A0AAV9LMR9_9SOLN|nr:hypothetical protein R3W88_031474 [Solanum pinnatisectum]
MIVNMFNGYSQLSLTIQRLAVFYKHRDNLFYPPWAFTLPNILLKVPIIVFFRQLFLIQQMATGIFRLIAGVCRKMVIAHTGGSLTLLLVFLLGDFILPKETLTSSLKKRWFWIGTAALLGFTILFNILFTFALMYLNRNLLHALFTITATRKPQAIISKKQARNVEGDQEEGKESLRRYNKLT